MDKTYDPKKIESIYQKLWSELNIFSADYQAGTTNNKSYCIMLPPPNVTGSLHMGHAFQHTIMDVLVRYHRMLGQRTLWQPGTDHAGIATQLVVKGQLFKQGRTNLSREQFVAEVWRWKEKSGGTISQQMRRLGVSVDWARERFTMDEGLSCAVNEVFVRLYQEGLIYRGKRLVNWDPILKTAVSDLEVKNVEEKGHLWHIRYPVVASEAVLIVATTRPETMLGDSAIAVHPDDKRYQHLIGQMVHLPLTNRHIPIIADEYVDKDFGTGCVKITPAHDFNDYQVGKRHNLAMINIFDQGAYIIMGTDKGGENIPPNYQGLAREKAREAIIRDLENQGLLHKTEAHTFKVPRGDRTSSIIEPYLTNQWFVKTAPLTKAAIEAVKNKAIRFVPSNWAKTYFSWMHNIEDWCISRQIWWGHRIPAWYDKKGNIFVANSQAAAQEQAGTNTQLTQDDDVLDTWFSSALWPFSTLGWPSKSEELATFYPTNVLVTGFDIIFFWVARMIMFGLKFTKQIPFKDIYVTGLIRDQHGQKMSKSKGNVLDPIDLIDGISLTNLVHKKTQDLLLTEMKDDIIKNTQDEYPQGIPAFGADALRFTFTALASFGRDISFDLKRVAGYRNFCNKLWNATRFVLSNLDQNILAQTPKKTVPANQWIISVLAKNIRKTHQHLADYRLDLMAQDLYHFVWHDYCDWYLEFAKPLLRNADTRVVTEQTLLSVLLAILKLLHPIIPFISEDIYQQLKPYLAQTKPSLAQESYPLFQAENISDDAHKQMAWVQQFILSVRQIRTEMNIAPNKVLSCFLSSCTKTDKNYLNNNEVLLKKIAKLKSIKLIDANKAPAQVASTFIAQMKILIPLANLIDKEQEIARLNKELAKLNKQQQQLSTKLANKKFLAKAPQAIVTKEKEKLTKITTALLNLKVQSDKISKL